MELVSLVSTALGLLLLAQFPSNTVPIRLTAVYMPEAIDSS